MTPEQIAQFNEMKRELDALKSAISLNPDIETCFRERLGIIDFTTVVKGTGTTTASTQGILLSGDPQSITVPAQPSGALTVTYLGTTYNLLYK